MSAPTPPIVLSVDVEDYYMSPETIPFEDWGRYEDRIHVGLERLLELLDRHNSKATFFVLGYVAEKRPELVKKISKAGHEIGTHNYWHQPYEQMGKQKCLEGLKRSVALLEDITGAKVIGHRAPIWSVRRDMTWFFEALSELSIRYDSSLFPMRTYLYGEAQVTPEPHWISIDEHRKILEIPPSSQVVLGKRLPVGGGFFLRAYPLWWTRMGISRRLRSSQSVVLYVHPWELDPQHPALDLPIKLRWIHNLGLRGLSRKMDDLLGCWRFSSFRDALSEFETIASNGGDNA